MRRRPCPEMGALPVPVAIWHELAVDYRRLAAAARRPDADPLQLLAEVEALGARLTMAPREGVEPQVLTELAAEVAAAHGEAGQALSELSQALTTAAVAHQRQGEALRAYGPEGGAGPARYLDTLR